MMFKILILQAWYNLSDEALEEQIARDLMFRRFIGLSLSEAVTRSFHYLAVSESITHRKSA